MWQASLHQKFFGNSISKFNFLVDRRIGFQLSWVAEPHSPGPHFSPGPSGWSTLLHASLFSPAELACYPSTSQWHYKANLITALWAFWDSWRKGAIAVTMPFVIIRNGIWVPAEDCGSWIQASAVAICRNDPNDESGWMGNNFGDLQKSCIKNANSCAARI